MRSNIARAKSETDETARGAGSHAKSDAASPGRRGKRSKVKTQCKGFAIEDCERNQSAAYPEGWSEAC